MKYSGSGWDDWDGLIIEHCGKSFKIGETQFLSVFGCTFHPATLGSSPKHTNYAFFDLYSSNCIFVS